MGFSSGITTGVWMGRDDARAVSGLQGGTAPARAFAAYMRFAVRERPVEEFDTDLKLPEWQLEPDDEFYFGEQDDYYYYIDEEGNLVEPNGPRADRGPGYGDDLQVEGESQGTRPSPGPRAPPAANDDFLDRATGGGPADEDRRSSQGSREAVIDRRYQ